MIRTVRIAGSGPSGMSAAITLAKAGHTVEVHERNADAGMRFHGDLQGLENWSEDTDVLDSLRSMGISVNFDTTPFKDIAVTDGSTIWPISCSRPGFYLVKRGNVAGSIDQGLREQALAAGVRIRYKSALTEQDTDIIATGPRMGEVPAIAKGIVFETSLPDMALGMFNDKAAHLAYAYLLVTGGYGCLCSMVCKDLRLINPCFEEAKRLFATLVDLDIRQPRNVGGVGSISAVPEFRRGHALLVGEAAGLQDLMWGFGMRNALLSGHLAAQSIIQGASYERLASPVFTPRLKAGVVNRYIWERWASKGYANVLRGKVLERKGDPLPILNKMYTYRGMHPLIYPFAKRYIRKQYPMIRW
ncbi:hypothetical protein AUJ68_01685 [Candidatus Woesearchaeota archaeon CG1_02_57_44]|nr:MAG: hypothetical protein AUJ68_01685 [Candidatus Woesearchaeota archaeon CG1_02_57_44]